MTLIRVAILVALQLGRIGGRIEAPHPSHRAFRKPARRSRCSTTQQLLWCIEMMSGRICVVENGDTIFLT
jgi:hypothetical protein